MKKHRLLICLSVLLVLSIALNCFLLLKPDSPTLYLPRWKKELVEQAAKEAGTHCWKLSGDWWKGCYVICPRTHSQGYPRTKNAEAMNDHFNAVGYTGSVYYQMD